MGIYFGGQEYSKAYFGGMELSKAFLGGHELFSRAAPPPVVSVHHTITISSGGNASTVGYNAGRFGALIAGTAAYITPTRRNVTIVMCRRLSGNLVFVLSGTGLTANSLSDFPSRIIASWPGRTDVVMNRPATLRSISAGIRGDYPVASGDINAMFIVGQSTKVDLYY